MSASGNMSESGSDTAQEDGLAVGTTVPACAPGHSVGRNGRDAPRVQRSDRPES